MKELFIPKELMEQLEAKGFAEDCICGYTPTGRLRSKVTSVSQEDCNCIWDKYDNEVRAATWQQVVDWFREKHGITIYASDRISMKDWCGTMLQQGQSLKFYPKETYYEALTKIIEEALKLI